MIPASPQPGTDEAEQVPHGEHDMNASAEGLEHLLTTRFSLFGECVTRVMTLRALETGAVNLSQGFPETNPPPEVVDAAIKAIHDGRNQYADMRGEPSLRDAVAAYYQQRGFPAIDGTDNVTITCGSTEAMIASLLALIEPDDELIIFVPYYENFWAQAVITRAKVVFYALEPPDYAIDPERLEQCFSPRTKAVILNTPNNPTGRVYSVDELEAIGRLCRKYDAVALVDEVYEHIVFDEHRHTSMASVGELFGRTVTVSSISKIYAASGWRVGWAVAPKELTLGIRRMHDFLTATVPTPFQLAAVEALRLPASFYSDLRDMYARKRDILSQALRDAGVRFHPPQGTYYILAQVSDLGFPTSEQFAEFLLHQVGVACVPGSAYYRDPESARQVVRFTFSKREEVVIEGSRRLKTLRELLPKNQGR